MAHNRLGHRSFTRGDGPAALPHFVEAARLRPDLWLNRNNLALALAALGRHDEAAHEYEEACRVASPSMKPRALANLGAHLLNSGRPAEAKLIFGYLAGQFPRKPEFANNWAVALARTGNREAAIRQWRRALELEPDNEPAREALARALAGE
jgi:Flp pilus assembly protein TadD